MRDTELYRHLLGLEKPWYVSRVNLAVDTQHVDVWVDHPRGETWPCPECQKACTLYDHTDERTWRHLDSCQFQTLLHARPPRVKCPEHGVRQVRLPWAEPHARFTRLFERFALDVLLETNIQSAKRILRISWDEAWHLMDRAVKRGLAHKPERIISQVGVDEKSAGKGQNNYVTVISDLGRGTVEEVVNGRDSASLETYFQSLKKKQRAGIKALAMDMSGSYIAAVTKTFPDGKKKIVFDRYHIMKHVGDAVDTVRKQENKALGDRSPLKGTKYIWLYAYENLPSRYEDLFKDLRGQDLKTSRAWAIKENLRHLWRYTRLAWAIKHWKKWYFWATHSRLEPIKKAAKTLKDHLYGILNYFKYRITSGPVEGINSRIATLWKSACGFRNKSRMRIVILFHLGGLDLYPSTHTKP